MPRSSEEKHQFLSELYSKHYDFIAKYRNEVQSELDKTAIEKEGGSNNDENPSNEIDLFTDEAIAKALALTISDLKEIVKK